jgi:hypothetical protein
MSQSILVESPIDKLNYSTNINNDKLHSILSNETFSEGSFIDIFVNEDENETMGPLCVSKDFIDSLGYTEPYIFEWKEETPQFTKYYYSSNTIEWKCNNQPFHYTDYIEIKIKKGDKVDVEIKNYSIVGIPNDDDETSEYEIEPYSEYVFRYTKEGIYIENIDSEYNENYFYPKNDEYELLVQIGDLP